MSEREFSTGTYRCEIIERLPVTGPTFQFHRFGEAEDREGLVVRVTHNNGQSWVGNLWSPDESLRATVFPAPEGEAFFVLTGGRAYRIDPADPKQYEVVPLEPIREYHLVPELGLVIFYTFWRLAAYDARGLLWKSERINWDWLAVFSVTPDEIRCTGWNPETESYDQFLLDTRTGMRIERADQVPVSQSPDTEGEQHSLWSRIKGRFSR